MTEQGGGGLALEDVARRFAESEETLSRTRERLQGLIQAEETTTASAVALREAAAAVGSFVQRADSLLGELEGAQRQVREALEAATRFLDGSELREMKQAVEELSQAVVQRLTALEQKVADTEAANARARAAEAELERVTAALGGRQQRKLGLS
jgi:hypothetical protein